MAQRVRLVDIAERLGLTPVSVSKALRNHPDISSETRARVKQVASEMGYSPNLVARSLSSKRSHILGVVVPKIAHNFFASVLDAVQKDASQMGYGMVLAVSEENATLERDHIQRLLAMRVDGLLVSVTQQPPERKIYEQVREMKIPLVFFDRRIPDLDFNSVTVNDRRGAYQGVSDLIQKGYRQIAHIAGTPDVEIGRERRNGYEDALREHDIPVHDPWIVEGGFDEQHGYRSFRRIYKQGDLPEAIFAVSFPVALGISAAIQDVDPSLANRIQILSFGDGSMNNFYTHPYLSVRQPTSRIGHLAIALLLELIEMPEEDAPVRHIVLDTELVSPADMRRRIREEMQEG